MAGLEDEAETVRKSQVCSGTLASVPPQSDQLAPSRKHFRVTIRCAVAETRADTPTGRVTVERRSVDWIVCVAGLGVLLICALIVHKGMASSLEQHVFRWINGWPDFLSSPMRLAPFLGVLAVGPIVAGGAAVFRRWRLALAAIIVTVGKLAAERIVWHYVQRSRPGTTISGAIVRGDTPTSGLAFVSGHVVLVTGLAWVLTPHLRGGWRILPWAVVGLVSFARIYLGAHAPLDVIGGVGLGLIVGGTANLIEGVERKGAGSYEGVKVS